MSAHEERASDRLKQRTARRILRRTAVWIVLGSVLCVLALATAALWYFRPPAKVLPKPAACAVVSNVINTITRVFAPDGDFARLDVRKLTCAQFRERLEGVSPAATLWTPGDGDWLLVGAEKGCSVTLEQALDRMAEEDTVYSLPEIFANCVGTVAELLPAFEALSPDDGVVPELFVTKDIPAFAWFADGRVEPDIARLTRQEMRSMQVVRRLVLEGAIESRRGRENESIEKWKAAYLRSPNDTLLLERIDHLRNNAKVFLKVGKYGMATKCFETIVRVNPKDYVDTVNLGTCLQKAGHRDVAAAVFRKAEELKPKGIEEE